MFVGPVTHVACDLSTQQRILAARRDAAVRAALGGRRRSLRDRVLRRDRDPAPAVADARVLAERGEDVWHALRY